MAQVTPMMQQYLQLKEQHKDEILMFRLGDFYEMFFDDAKLVSRELGLTLTGRNCGLEERAPMCGVPHHALDNYVSKLIAKGYKVAICDQMEDPSQTKTIVKREITRIITPGTVIESSILTEGENNYILSVHFGDSDISVCYSDISTGEFCVIDTLDEQKLLSELTRLSPREVITGDSNAKRLLTLCKKLNNSALYVNTCPDYAFEYKIAQDLLLSHFQVQSLKGFGIGDKDGAICAAGALMHYLKETQKNALTHINKISLQQDSAHMVLDSSTCRNLELTQTMIQGGKRGSLLWVLDKTRTAAGARKLKQYLLHPLKEIGQIKERLDAVEAILNDGYIKTTLTEYLGNIYDFERIISKISYETLDARDCITLKNSLAYLPEIKKIIADAPALLIRTLHDDIDELQDIYELLDRAIAEDPVAGITSGGIIKAGYNTEVDTLRTATDEGMQWLAVLEKKEKEATGIKNLKIRFNKVFGYYIEVSKSNLSQVPYRYTRKQTLVNAERFITEELKEMEETIMGAEEKRNALEYRLFAAIREVLAGHIPRIQQTAAAIAALDVLLAFANLSYSNSYVKPNMTENGAIRLVDSRHPVVEQSSRESFVPNDVLLDHDQNNMLLITGPNMSGKSTYMRQTGLIVLMAHIGCFVPAASAAICVVDRIFTRVGASDDLASGQSTFMVEMNELANILNNATERSLVILDEIGRGTSTVDGLSIAWASVEYMISRIRAKTMFATHYHELIELENLFPQVKNCSVAVSEIGQEIVFLHKIIEGGTDKSFGIEVARLAGLPQELISSARICLEQLQEHELSLTRQPPTKAAEPGTVREPHYLSPLRRLDINSLTPIEALNVLHNVKKEMENEAD